MAIFDDNTLYILDSYGLIYRAYFAFISHPLMHEGRNVSAVFGFFRNLHNVLERYRPKCLVAALDSIGPTFRHERYPEYKANRPKTPEDLTEEIPWIEEILETLGIPSIRVNGYEADDIIATLARKCERAGRTCRILSGDKDLMQIVNESIQIMKPDHVGVWKVIEADGVKAEWGVEPERLLDLLSLTGDAADNVPGVKGVGVKTALKYLEQYGSLAGIYEHADEIKGAIGTKIRNEKENAFFSRELITLCETVPLDDLPQVAEITELLEGGKSARSFEERFDFLGASEKLFKYGCPSVARNYAALGGKSGAMADEGAGKNAEGKSETKKEAKNVKNTASSGKNALDADSGEEEREAVKNKGDYKSITSVSALHSFIDEAIEKKVVAYDSETTGLDSMKDRILGFSLSIKKGTGVWVPFKNGESLFDAEFVSKEEAFAELKRIFDNPEITVVMHNAKFDYKFLVTNGMQFEGGRTKCKIFDTLTAAWLLDPDKTRKKSYSLENLGKIDLALVGTEFTEIVPKGQVFTDIPLEVQTAYASEDADFTLQLMQLYEPQLKENNLWELFTKIEMPLMPILSDMEIYGIHLEKEILYEFDKELTLKIEDLQNDIYAIAGHSFNIASPKQLGEVLFNEMGLKVGKKNRTGYSTDSSVLEEIAAYHPIGQKLLDFREYTKLQSTYVETLPELCDGKGYIHTTYLQTGTATGRLSCKDPNLQNIPIRNEMGRRIRSAFVAPKGKVFVSADYSQIELVVLAHLSGDQNMCDAFEKGIDVHRATASMIYGVSPDDVTAEMRRTAKTINFGVIYGMGAFSLSKDLGITRKQSAEFIERYYEKYSAIRDFMDGSVQKAETDGYLETIMGRRRYIAGIKNVNKMEKAAAERIAKNTPVQGSAADIVKKAMIDLDSELRKSNNEAKLLLQVHDELILECPDDEKTVNETIEIVRRCMENAVKLKVPLKVSVECGKNWGEFH